MLQRALQGALSLAEAQAPALRFARAFASATEVNGIPAEVRAQMTCGWRETSCARWMSVAYHA